MPDLLLELFSEEIPARMQSQAAGDLRRLVTDALVEAGLTYEGARAFATPRRLTLSVHGLTVRSADVTEERKGPRVGAPEKAIEGFLRGAGLSSIEQAKIEKDPKKGDFYVARVTKPGRAAEEIIAEVVPAMIRAFPWPKSMRWGARSAPSDSPFAGNDAEGTSSLRWVRPLRSILCTFGPETEEPVVVDFEVAGIAAGDLTYGHRFMRGGEPIVVRRFDDYLPKLEAAKVVLDHERRQAIIEAEAKNLAFAQGLEVVEDLGLLEEVAGLVEWPVVLMGAFDESYLAIPAEVIRLTIRQNQKCFVLRHAGALDPSRLAPLAPQGEGVGGAAHNPPHGEVRARSASLEPSKDKGRSSDQLTNRFILVSNLEASDGGKEIVAGNERVIAARLSDARFFWEQDLKIPLEKHAKKLETITFHEKLGSQAERVERIARLAVEIADVLSSQPNFFHGKQLDAEQLRQEQEYLRRDVERAARLAKADLTTGMVGEFPELQGVMGRYYALAPDEGGKPREKPAVADAIRDHYKPQGPNDSVPSDPVSVAVALADKLDTLVGFWAIDEKPTGSKDPYALRRAALGVTRVLVTNRLNASLSNLFGETYWQYVRPLVRDRMIFPRAAHYSEEEFEIRPLPDGQHIYYHHRIVERIDDLAWGASLPVHLGPPVQIGAHGKDWFRTHAPTMVHVSFRAFATDLLAFFADRLKVHLRETGARHDLIDAVFALPGQDDLLMIVRRVEALGRFLDTDDGKNLLIGYRRAANILRAEEKKDGEGAFDDAPDPRLIEAKGEPEEKALFHVMQAAERDAREHVEREEFEGAMRALAELRPAVDAFFDKVTVNAEDAELRKNRLKLLNMLRRATLAVADFSKIGG